MSKQACALHKTTRLILALLIGFYPVLDTVGELSRTCCQLVQRGFNIELTLSKLEAYTTKSYPKPNLPTVSFWPLVWQS
jgi:hypothetical protein